MAAIKRIGIPSNRIETLKVIAASLLDNTIPCHRVLREFDEVKTVDSMAVEEKIRRLLQVLFSTRALDTTLAEFVKKYGYTDPSEPSKKFRSLHGYLRLLCYGEPATVSIRKLEESYLEKYQKNIIDKRNRYMHEADAFPMYDLEILILLSEMNECLARVYSLI